MLIRVNTLLYSRMGPKCALSIEGLKYLTRSPGNYASSLRWTLMSPLKTKHVSVDVIQNVFAMSRVTFSTCYIDIYALAIWIPRAVQLYNSTMKRPFEIPSHLLHFSIFQQKCFKPLLYNNVFISLLMFLKAFCLKQKKYKREQISPKKYFHRTIIRLYEYRNSNSPSFSVV